MGGIDKALSNICNGLFLRKKVNEFYASTIFEKNFIIDT